MQKFQVLFLLLLSQAIHPNLVLHFQNKCLYIIELTVGFESNLPKNANRKKLKYLEVLNQLKDNYRLVKFFNLSMSSLGLFDKSSSEFIDMMKDLELTTDQTSFIIKRIMNVAIRPSYFIFCCRNRECCNSKRMNY